MNAEDILNKHLAESEEAPSEKQAHGARCAVAPGSLPAFECNNLARYWEQMRDHWKLRAGDLYLRKINDLAGECTARAETFDACAKELRGHLACAIKRQPEENNAGVPCGPQAAPVGTPRDNP